MGEREKKLDEWKEGREEGKWVKKKERLTDLVDCLTEKGVLRDSVAPMKSNLSTCYTNI